MTDCLTKETRALLDTILDQLIPANPARNIPAAGAFGVGDFIEHKRVGDGSFAAHLDHLLDRAKSWQGDVNPDAVRQLETDLPEAFEVLLKMTYMGYYSRPEIRNLLGVAPWPVHPKGYEVPPEDHALLEDLTQPVRLRGPVYRNI